MRADIRRVGVPQILRYCQPGVLSDANALLNFIDLADWSRCPVRHRFLPEVAKRCYPVFSDTGDFFDFDSVNWRPISSPLLEADADGALVGEPAGRGVQRSACRASVVRTATRGAVVLLTHRLARVRRARRGRRLSAPTGGGG